MTTRTTWNRQSSISLCLRLLLSAGLLALPTSGLACGSGGGNNAETLDSGADSDTDVDAACLEGQIRMPSGECYTSPCWADPVGGLGAQCAAQHRQCDEDEKGGRCGDCYSEYVWDDSLLACRSPLPCDTLDCAVSHRRCIESSKDAYCAECLDGYDEHDGECVRINCQPGAVGSILDQCSGQSRFCVDHDEGEPPACEECWEGFAEREGVCSRVKDCLTAQCGVANKTCIPAAGTVDADCGACLPGYTQSGFNCVADQGATCADIAYACENQLHRECVERSPAVCGDCLEGYVDVAKLGGCVKKVACDSAACSALGRTCTLDGSPGCGDCVTGYVSVLGTSQCRKLQTCMDLDCGNLDCVPATNRYDAFCAPSCPQGEVPTVQGCKPCNRTCTGPGEEGVWAVLAANGKCLCRTKPGYFFTFASSTGTFRCDADGDGWVRQSARSEMESDDPEIRDNARCDLSKIKYIRLVNEAGQTKTIRLMNEVPLYESDRNDDDELLNLEFSDPSKALPKYGVGGKTLPFAKELNRFTKVCHTLRTDYNDNGVADIEEHTNTGIVPYKLTSDQLVFNKYAYYVELHDGRLDASRTTWVITERKRTALATLPEEDMIPMSFAQMVRTVDGEPRTDEWGWKTCRVDPDPKGLTNSGAAMDKPGYDFVAMSEPPGFAGMNHHSLFKCVGIGGTSPTDTTLPKAGAGEGYPKPDDALFSLCRRRETVAGGQAESIGGVMPLACTASPTSSLDGQWAYWRIAPYMHYSEFPPDGQACEKADGAIGVLDETAQEKHVYPAYQGGCVNQAVVHKQRCDIGSSCVCSDYGPSSTKGFSYSMRQPPCDGGLGFTWGMMNTCGESGEICDGVDNNGNGVIDEGYKNGADCTVTQADVDFYSSDAYAALNGGKKLVDKSKHRLYGGSLDTYEINLCRRGKLTCEGAACGGEGNHCVKCKPVHPNGEKEECDGLDNDCSGDIDDNMDAKDFVTLEKGLDKEIKFSWNAAITVRSKAVAVMPEIAGANCWMPDEKPTGWTDDPSDSVILGGLSKSACSVGRWTCNSTTKKWECERIRKHKTDGLDLRCEWDNADRNCNGKRDYSDIWGDNTTPPTGTAGKDYFVLHEDSDGDGFGLKTSFRYYCLKTTTGWVLRDDACLQANNTANQWKCWDLCDKDADANPNFKVASSVDGVLGWSRGKNKCGSYDWNGDGNVTPRWGSAAYDCNGAGVGKAAGPCGDNSVGFHPETDKTKRCAGDNPGQKFHTGVCFRDGLTCSARSETRQQECR